MTTGKIPSRKITRGSQHIESYVFSYKLPDDETFYNYDLSQFTNIRMDVRRANNPFNPVIYSVSLADGMSITKKQVYDDSIPEGEEPVVLVELDQLNIIHSREKTLLFEADGEYYRDILFELANDEGMILMRGKLSIEYNITA